MGKKKSTKYLVVVLLGLLQALSISCAATATEVVSSKIRSGLIEKSDVIALVDLRTIKKLTEADRLPTGFPFEYLAYGRVLQSVVGHPGIYYPMFIYSRKPFYSDSGDFGPGKFLVFLRYEQGKLVSTAENEGLFAVHEDSMKGYASSLHETATEIVLKQIQKKLPPLKKLPEPLQNLWNSESLDAEHVDHSIAPTTYWELHSPSVYWSSYREALKDASQNRANIKYVLKTGSPSGQLYAALLLYQFDRKAGIDAFKKLEKSNADVRYRQGDLMSDVRISKIAAELIKDKKSLCLRL